MHVDFLVSLVSLNVCLLIFNDVFDYERAELIAALLVESDVQIELGVTDYLRLVCSKPVETFNHVMEATLPEELVEGDTTDPASACITIELIYFQSQVKHVLEGLDVVLEANFIKSGLL